MSSTTLRYIGNLILIIGYFVLLHVNMSLGLIIKCIGGVLTIPFAIQNKLWDVLFLCGFFGIIETIKLIQLMSK